MAVRSYVDVDGTNELNHLLGANQAVVENYLRFHSYLFRQGLQTGTVLFAVVAQDVRMSGPGDDVDDIIVIARGERREAELPFSVLMGRPAGR